MTTHFIVDNNGEIIRSVDLEKEKLSVRSKTQDQAYRDKKLREKDSLSFTFSEMENVPEAVRGLTNAQCGLLLILSAYVDYDGILRTGKTALTRKDLQRILDIERTTLYKFLKLCTEKDIIRETEEGFLVNSRYHFKGKSKSKGLVKNMTTKIKKLQKENKLADLGLLYKIQSHVHISRNVLVKNPDEKELDKLVYLNKEELSELLEVSTVQLSKVLGRLKVEGQLCVAQLRMGRETNFVVNPEIFSRTASIKDETLRLLFQQKRERK